MPLTHLACVVGARPNFMKMAPLLRALDAYAGVRTTLIHTGQHYDANLSGIFFRELGMRRPDVNLEVGSVRQGQQTARILERMELVLQKGPNAGKGYDGLVVVGDVNSTMAAALAAAKLGIPVAHVEAGLRSFDRTMPEEINRIVTDSISEMLFVSEPSGLDNLRREGHPEGNMHHVGNVMIDTLMHLLPQAGEWDVCTRYNVSSDAYGVVTLHRPANVDDRVTLSGILDVLAESSRYCPLVFPTHPRTGRRIEEFGLVEKLNGHANLIPLEQLGYLDFLALTSQARVIVTDSGGLQEEATVLGIPCLTMRPHTERPVTVEEGTSTLVGSDPVRLRQCLDQVFDGTYKQGRAPDLWDGRAAERIAAVLAGETSAGRRKSTGSTNHSPANPVGVANNDHSDETF